MVVSCLAKGEIMRKILMMFFLLSTALMWGSSFLWIAEAIESLEPASVTLIRLILGAIALGVTGPILRSTGLAHDARSYAPYAAYGLTPLMAATNRGNVAIVKLLLDSGADVHAKSVFGKTAYNNLRMVQDPAVRTKIKKLLDSAAKKNKN